MIKESQVNTNRFSLGLSNLKIGSNVKGVSLEGEIEPTREGDLAKVLKSLTKKNKLKKKEKHLLDMEAKEKEYNYQINEAIGKSLEDTM